ncbi:MAG TPA: metallophosphoesterase [Chthonomonadaceae bacterium]|nr:metallophosphoesterase [Chthonomonadaceae bacterium]
MSEYDDSHRDADGIDRRGFLKCMAWAGTGLLCTLSSGVLSSASFGQPAHPAMTGMAKGDFSFVQISDSHIGFSKEANKDVIGTLQAAIAKINALPEPPDFLLHTGDISHLSKPEEFDTVDQLLRTAKVGQRFFVPGEHDVLNDNGKLYLERYGRGTQGGGWYSFHHKGAHFIGLVNVLNLKAGGLGALGPEQLAWLEKDVRGLKSSTPIVVFAHIPLWTVYPEWGWGTDDGAQALSTLRRFGSVTVLNGHIHQTLQKVEGNVTFHTAMSTAFPQPKPGAAPSPGPMKVPAEQLRSLLGVTSVHYRPGQHPLAVIDSPLALASAAQTGQNQNPAVHIDNFRFQPDTLTVPAGAQVTWINRDDVPHVIASTDNRFKSRALDTDETFSYRFSSAGTYPYFCSLHPTMTGKVIVT